MVPENSNRKAHRNEKAHIVKILPKPPVKDFYWSKRLRSGFVHDDLLLIKLQQMPNRSAFQAVKFYLRAIISIWVLLDYFLQVNCNFMAVHRPKLFAKTILKKDASLYRGGIII